ncbi:hypothetical protein SUGI_0122610 [Cryptomeria japonica]|nr:hypothetical protein SUGI_0122610 [Cryptomeria japonica]
MYSPRKPTNLCREGNATTPNASARVYQNLSEEIDSLEKECLPDKTPKFVAGSPRFVWDKPTGQIRNPGCIPAHTGPVSAPDTDRLEPARLQGRTVNMGRVPNEE